MNTYSFSSLAALTALTCLAINTPARAASTDVQGSPWSLSLLGGSWLSSTGTLRAPAVTSGAFGTLEQPRLHYDDAFDSRYDLGLEVGYAIDPNVQAFGRLDYGALDGRHHVVGRLTSDALAAPAALTAHFDDQHNTSFSLGSRYTWSTGSDFRPFAEVALGVTHLDATRAELGSSEALLPPRNVMFTHGDNVFSQAIGTGIDFQASPNIDWRVGISAAHSGVPLQAHDATLTALGFNDRRDPQGSSWSYPVSIAAAFRFE